MRLLSLILTLISLHNSTDLYADQLGESIFQKGLGRDGREISASLPGQVSLQGEAVACIGCHGEGGQGGGESFVTAPNIRWNAITQRFAERKAGSSRNSYDKNTFTNAVNKGVSAEGSLLDPIMPRFNMTSDEIEALINYLATSDQNKTTALPVALSLMPTKGISKLADALAVNMLACSDLTPGTHLWPLEVIRFKSPEDAIYRLQSRLASGRIRFIVAPFIAGWETAYINLMAQFSTATLMPFTPLDLPEDKGFFLAFPGLQKQLRALIDEAVARKINHLSVLTSGGDILADTLYQQTSEYSLTKGVQLHRGFESSMDNHKSPAALLILSPLNSVIEQIKAVKQGQNILTLIPAPYFDPSLGEALPKWLIAYPYPPQSSGDKRNWQPLLARWSTAVCSILAMASENQNSEWWKANSQLIIHKIEDDKKQDIRLIPEHALVLPWPEN